MFVGIYVKGKLVNSMSLDEHDYKILKRELNNCGVLEEISFETYKDARRQNDLSTRSKI